MPRIIKSSEMKITCPKCGSLIGIRPDEIHKTDPGCIGPYEMDDFDNTPKKYWKCPQCKKTNYIVPPKDDY